MLYYILLSKIDSKPSNQFEKKIIKKFNKLASFKKGIQYVGWQNIENLGSS